MPLRLDPSCPGARRLRAAQETRARLFGRPGRLGELVAEANQRDARAHLARCARCGDQKAAPPETAAKPPLAPKKPRLASAYAALGLRPGATPFAVHAAFRERARRCHPDVVGPRAPALRESAQIAMRELNAAYDAIRRTW